MKLQISLPTETWNQIIELADEERRPPKYQIEHLVIEALRARRADTAPSEVKEVANVS